MENETKAEMRIGEIYLGQRWVELHGCFTIAELSEIILKINENNRGAKDNGNS